MLSISAEQIDRTLTFPTLVDALDAAFREGAVQPVRHHHTIERGRGTNSTLLLMPAWTDFKSKTRGEGFAGVKIVTVSPDNGAVGKPAVVGVYLLLDGVTGEPLAMMDGPRLTQWRTACASALAARYLAREDAFRLFMIGAGAQARFLVRAHAAVRPIREIRIWNRTPDNAEKFASELVAEGYAATVETELDRGVEWADIISSATIASDPLIRGECLRPGAHVDLVGGFTPAMREADDATVRRARIFVDTLAGAMVEAGDIVQPIQAGTILPDAVLDDLHGLVRGRDKGRITADEITLFKSVGTALEDLAAGIEVYKAFKPLG